MNLQHSCFVLLLSIFGTFHSQTQNWPNLKMGYIYSTWYGSGFIDHPRTIEEAKKENWFQVDETADCKSAGNGKYIGFRYGPPKSEPTEITLIFGINGFIVGMQSVVPKDKALSDKYFKFSSNKMYNEDVINGVDVYVTTAYFVDPNIICDAGRSQEGFDKEGTGYALFFQNGPTPDDIEAAPLTAEDAKKNEEWYGYGCIENMGEHWIKLDPNNEEPRCDEVFPAFLLFEHGEDRSLVGFVWSHVAWYTNFRNEHARSIGFSYIFDTVPQCVNDLAKDPGITSLHVYFKDYHQYC